MRIRSVWICGLTLMLCLTIAPMMIYAQGSASAPEMAVEVTGESADPYMREQEVRADTERAFSTGLLNVYDIVFRFTDNDSTEGPGWLKGTLLFFAPEAGAGNYRRVRIVLPSDADGTVKSVTEEVYATPGLVQDSVRVITTPTARGPMVWLYYLVNPDANGGA